MYHGRISFISHSDSLGAPSHSFVTRELEFVDGWIILRGDVYVSWSYGTQDGQVVDTIAHERRYSPAAVEMITWHEVEDDDAKFKTPTKRLALGKEGS